jgi:hypothetical protein
MKKLLLATTMLCALASGANADFVLTPAQEGQSGVMNYVGIGNSALTASITYTLIDVNAATNTWLFGYALDNTTAAPWTSRVSTFGFSTDPALLSAGITAGTVFTNDDSGNVPQVGPVQFCATSSNNCAGGGGSGVLPGDGIVTGAFSIDFADNLALASVTFSDLFVRFQSVGLIGSSLEGSDTGIPSPGPIQFCTTPPCTPQQIPGPALGAGIPGLIAACAGLIAFARRRRAAA